LTRIRDDEPLISKQLWRKWAETARRRDQAAARKRNTITGLAFAALIIGASVYVFALR
jgi:hypothetical protein